jgi:hypothetical protein
MDDMKLKPHRRNLLHKDAIEREWPSGPHGGTKKHDRKVERLSQKEQIQDGIEEYKDIDDWCCPECPHPEDDDYHHYYTEVVFDDPEGQEAMRKYLDPQTMRRIEKYLTVDETEN